jgi:hypothetical protein
MDFAMFRLMATVCKWLNQPVDTEDGNSSTAAGGARLLYTCSFDRVFVRVLRNVLYCFKSLLNYSHQSRQPN